MHDVFPLATSHLVVVIAGQLVNPFVGRLAAGHRCTHLVIVGKHILQRAACSMLPGTLGFQHLLHMGSSSLNGILDGSKVGIGQFWSQGLADFLHFCIQSSKASLKPVTLFLGPVAVAHLRESPVIEFLVYLHLIPSHELRTPHAAEPVELVHHGEEPFADLLTELPTKPGLIVIIQCLTRDTVDVPGHIEKEFQVVASHLRIMHVHNPKPAHIVVVGLTHLIVYQSGLGGRQPEVQRRHLTSAS